MKKIHLGLIGIATLFLTACTVGTSSNRYIDKGNHTREDDSITNLKVTFNFGEGKYDGQEQYILNDVKPTSYWKYIQGRLDETKITSPEHTTFEGFSFAKDDPSIIQDSYVVKEDITVYAQYKAKEGEYCTVSWKDGETSKIIKTETYFEGEKPELKDIPYHEGKTFDHWEPAITPITKDDLGDSREYKAIYVPLKTIYTVTLNYDDDSEQPIHTQTVLNGKCAVKPEVTKEGYELKDWTYIDGGEGEFNFNTPITKDGIKIKANWEEPEPFLQCVTMTFTITKPTTISFDCDEDDRYIVEWEDDTFDSKKYHDYQSGIHSINIFGSGKLKSFKLTSAQSCLSVVNIANIESLGDSAFEDCSAITSINIPSSVTSIGEYAFTGCSQLQTVTFDSGSKLTSIGNFAFYSCSSLTGITIPSSVTSIGYSAFDFCPNLTFNIYNECKYLGNNDNRYLALIGGVNKNVVINENCRVIGGDAFRGCSALTGITIPSEVTSIGVWAFYSCSQLQTIIFNDKSQLTLIDAGAFRGCSALTNITIPSSVTSIGSNAFQDCLDLETVTFEEESQLESIGYAAFSGCSSLTGITIPSSVTSIGDSAFEGCLDLETVTFAGESKLASVGAEAFRSCSNLQTVDLTALNAVPTLDDYVFLGCHSNLKIHVKTNMLEAFKTADGWKEYKDKITDDPVPSTNV